MQRVRRRAGPGQDGPAIIGQNWDWLLHAAQTLVVLEVRLAAGNPCQAPYERLDIAL